MKNIWILLSLIFYTSFNIAAQESSDTIDIEDVIITATRALKSDAITQETIQRQKIDAISVGQDPVILIEELSPSIISYTDGGTPIGNYSQFRLRGMDQSRVNISLNGVPLNDMVDHGVYFSNFSDLGNSIESMQIVRGVGITNSGLASYAGAINFESIQIFGDKMDAGAQVTLGSFGTLRTAAEINSGLMSNGVGLYTRVTRTQTDGYKFNSGSNSYSMFFSGGWLSGKSMIKLTAFSGTTQNGQSYEHVPFSIIQQEPKTNFNNLNDLDDFEQHMVQLQWAYQIQDNVNLDVIPYYNGAGGVFPYTFDGVQYMYGLTNDHYGIKANLGLEKDNQSVHFGMHAYDFDRTNLEYVSPFQTEPYTRDYTDKSEISTYLKYRYKQEKMSLLANLEGRFLRMDMTGDESLGVDLDVSNTWTFINGLVGLKYKLSDHDDAYLSFGRSQREPTRSDINNGVSNSESVNDIELGYNTQYQGLSISANAFYMSFSDEISEIGALQDRSYIEIRQNIESSTRQGVEVSSLYKLNKSTQVSVNASYTHTNISEYDNGNQIFEDVQHIFSPNWIIQPSIELGSKYKVKVMARHVSNSFSELSNNVNFIIPAHTTLNAQLSLNLSHNWKLTGIINNITNQLYFTEGSPIDADFDGNVEGVGYRIQPPRNFYIMINYNL